MKASLVIAAAVAVTSLQAAEVEDLQHTFAVQPGGEVSVDVDFGSIQISTNATSEVTVEVHRQIGLNSSEKELAFLKGNPVEFIQDGNKVVIRQRGKSKSGIWNWMGSQRKEAKYIVHVPAQFGARANTSGGDIEVRDLQGPVNANTSGGGLKFSRIQGPLKGDTSGGGIKVADCQGDSTVSTSGGGITVNGGGGKLHADTSGGSISVKNFAGPAHASTSGGGIVLENIGGEVKASTSGGSISASLAKGVSEEIDLGTSGGSLVVKVPEKAAFDLDASTTGGGVSCDLPVEFTGKKKHGELHGPVNGGGKTIKLRTSGGSIHVRTQPATS
ncbi:MAG TPA: DUF4097 family beta strand repeat-containing protein [Candidatus Limnocylindria bacterium]|nr:DUF4097 family beta strand repeat-containing protein [Candidatus Limnocylindria bacterium]